MGTNLGDKTADRPIRSFDLIRNVLMMPLQLNTLFLAFALVIPALTHANEVTGAGSSAAKPLYEKWAAHYQQKHKLSFNYQPVGSSKGIEQIKARAVAFGASDVAMSREEMDRQNMLCFPVAILGVVPVFNVPGIRAGELQLTGEVLADMLSGRIRSWDDAAIASLNPRIALPKLPIVPVVREEGSGTTYNLSDYLSKVSPSWKSTYGTGFVVKWPAGTMQVKGSAGIVTSVRQTAGALGYVDYNYVVQDKLVYPKLKNRDGKFVAPTPTTFSAAVSDSGWKSRAAFEEMLTDRGGPFSWPITMGTFVIVPKTTGNPAATTAALQFFTWAFVNGDALADNLDFVRVPDNVQARIYRELIQVTDQAGKQLPLSLMQ